MAESDSVSRQRLRPWLIAQINGGNVPGLYWLNAEKTKFKIPWKHAGNKDWDPSYGQIFKVRAQNVRIVGKMNLTVSVPWPFAWHAKTSKREYGKRRNR